MKYCKYCNKEVSLSDKSHWVRKLSRTNVSGYSEMCRFRIREYDRTSMKKKPDVYRDRKLKSKFGISLAQYNELLKYQNEVCAICNQKCKVRLAVDHNHITKEIRGLLCGSCNRAIGSLKVDSLDIKLLESAIEYIKGSNNANEN